MTYCKYHPKYNPASGEPTDSLSAMVNYGSVKDIPCYCCLQARVKWLENLLKDIRYAALDSIHIFGGPEERLKQIAVSVDAVIGD